MKPLTPLGSLQREVMELVWKLGEVTVADLHKAITRRREVTYTTVLSATQKLEKKGLLKHRSEGRAYVYMPTRSREESRGRALGELLRSTFQGDPRLLLSSLLDETSLSQKDLGELRALIDQHRKAAGREGKP